MDGARIHTQPGRVVAGQEWYYHTDNTTHVTGWGRYDVIVPYLAVGNR